MELTFHEELEYFGEEIGSLPIYQITQSAFNTACDSKRNASADNLGASDSTGKRIYSGTYVVIRFFHRIRELFSTEEDAKSVVEIGCGTGTVGAILSRTCNLHRLLLTDGNTDTLTIAHKNMMRLSGCQVGVNVNIAPLYWPETIPNSVTIHPEILSLFEKYNNAQPFDIVLGTELMYYTTDIAQLFSTFRQLTGHKHTGIFFHGHVFRRSDQILEWLKETAKYNYVTMEIPPNAILTRQELSEHPEWYRVRVLFTAHQSMVSTITDRLQNLNNKHPTVPPLIFVPFQEEFFEEDANENEEEEQSVFALFR